MLGSYHHQAGSNYINSDWPGSNCLSIKPYLHPKCSNFLFLLQNQKSRYFLLPFLACLLPIPPSVYTSVPGSSFLKLHTLPLHITIQPPPIPPFLSFKSSFHLRDRPTLRSPNNLFHNLLSLKMSFLDPSRRILSRQQLWNIKEVGIMSEKLTKDARPRYRYPTLPPTSLPLPFLSFPSSSFLYVFLPITPLPL